MMVNSLSTFSSLPAVKDIVPNYISTYTLERPAPPEYKCHGISCTACMTSLWYKTLRTPPVLCLQYEFKVFENSTMGYQATQRN